MEIKLSKRNEEVYEEVKRVMGEGGKCAIVQPTGTGKSYILMKLLSDYDGYKIVIGSSNQVLKELALKEEWNGDDIIRCTYHNLDILKKFIIDNGIEKDISLIAIDELHRAGAETWYTKIKEIIQLVPNARILGLTATPIRYLDKKRDMVKELFNGVSVSNLTLKEAIKNGILPSPKYVTAMFSIDKDIKDRFKLIGSKDKTQKAEYAREIIQQYLNTWDRDNEIINILNQNIGDYYDKNYKHIVFVPSIVIANEIRDSIQKWFESVYRDKAIVNIYTAHSKNKESSTELNNFCRVKQGNIIDVLISVNMANEGLHIDNTKSVILLRNTQSPILYLQQIGRALSVGGCEPIIFDFVGSIKAIGNILDLLDTFDIKVTNRVYDEISTMSTGILKEYKDNTKDFRDMLKDIDNMFSNSWQSNYNALYQEISDNSINSLNEIQNKQLLKWAKSQQRQFINNTLEKDKLESLQGLGVIMYKTDRLDKSDLDILDIVSKGNISILENLKYRLYCGKLPIEILLYLKNSNIELRVTSEEMFNISLEYNRELSLKVKYMIDKILNDDTISILSDRFNIHKYLETIKNILYINNELSKEDTDSNIALNILKVYWGSYKFKISSRVELNASTLLKHIDICNEYLKYGCIDDTKYIDKKDNRYRLSYTYKLIEKINKLA